MKKIARTYRLRPEVLQELQEIKKLLQTTETEAVSQAVMHFRKLLKENQELKRKIRELEKKSFWKRLLG